METLDPLHARLADRFGADVIEPVANPGPSAQHSLLVTAAGHSRARDIAVFLRDDPVTRLDYCSNVTGLDWPGKTAGSSGYLEAVYHLYSIAQKTSAPVILRLRTANRTDAVTLPSLTPVWRSCEFQEREIFDLYGIVFEGHPDLRRLLMWDEFKDHPMRKDYVSPDDYEWEPTPHDDVLTRAKAHYPATATEATA
ncbi:NADH:ubiquinone oxidoreductase 27 kD subunit [Opitutaceae bacterium TAV1]|nr:NADH:ubiquinone oxidoreductase 27 kD subunit [Opitutaceae bacterium TAV1]